MTGIELAQALSEYSYPLPPEKRQGIFALYAQVTGTPKERRCPNCATDAYFELRILARDYQENEIPLKDKSKRMATNSTEPKLVKYRIKKAFRAHGDPKIYDNHNTSDKEAEALMRINPALSVHFEFLIQQPKVVHKKTKESEPKKVKKKLTSLDIN